ncbi:MAG: hypothetical protein ACLFTU_10010 [Puniceicoccaceae bacterium]
MMHSSNSEIVTWDLDRAGLPFFSVLPAAAQPDLPEPYSLLGNHGLNAFVDARGRAQLHASERSWACLNGNRPERVTLHEIEMQAGDAPAFDLAEKEPDRCRFGCGMAAFDYRADDFQLERGLCTPPSETTGRRLPFLFVTLTARNTGSKTRTLRWRESFGARYDFSFRHNFPFHKSRVDYPVQVESSADLLRAHFTPKPEMPLVLAEGNEPAWQESFPPSLYLNKMKPLARLTHSVDPDGLTAWLTHEITLEVDPGETATATFVVGCAEDDFDWATELGGVPAPDESFFRAEWRKVIPVFEEGDDPDLAREMQWHAYCLHAMATWSARYEETFIPQGTIYEYGLGVAAVIRDHLQHSLPLCRYEPALAASILRFTGKHTNPRGHIQHGDEGANQHPLGADQKSDSQIYALMALAEYLRTGNDPSLLAEPIHFLDSPRPTDLLDCAARWFRYLRDEVKTGPHGLVRLLCSDWNDCFYGFFKEIPYHRIFSEGESGLNSTMAVVVLGRVADALEAVAEWAAAAGRSADVEALAAAARAYRAELLEAVLKEMRGRDFITRAYVGENAVGRDELFFEPQPWLLMIPELKDRHAAIWKAIRDRVWADEPCGARQRETPGQRENGGIWFALNGPLVEALNGLDASLAREALEKLTCRRRASTYPERWAGQWSLGDSLHSHRLQDPEQRGFMSSYLHPCPVFCAHAHAWPLHGWLLQQS